MIAAVASVAYYLMTLSMGVGYPLAGQSQDVEGKARCQSAADALNTMSAEWAGAEAGNGMYWPQIVAWCEKADRG